MLRKELIQTFRDPRMMFVILIVPVFQTLIFGYAVTTDVNRVETGIVDLANTVTSRATAQQFISSGIFIPTYMNSYADAWDAMDQGKIQAMLSSFFVIFPATLLSGFAFPIDNMPGVIRAITILNPVRYMMTILREIFLKGNGLTVLWPCFLALFLLGTALLTAATMRFKKTQ